MSARYDKPKWESVKPPINHVEAEARLREIVAAMTEEQFSEMVMALENTMQRTKG